MSLQVAAQHLAAHGRNGDSILVHMTPHEVAGLDALARAKYGHGLPTNPHTGMPEASLLGGMLPMILGIGGAMMGVPPMLTAAMVGGGTALASGSLMKGLSAGLGAYGGGEIGAGIGAMGTSGAAADAATAAGGTATSATTPMYDAAAPSATSAVGGTEGAIGNGFDGAAGDFGTGYASSASSPAYVNGMDAASDAVSGTSAAAAAPTSAASAGYAGDTTAAGYDPGYGGASAAVQPQLSGMDKMRAGIGAIGRPGSWDAFSNAMGGSKGMMQAGLMAASPMLSDAMQPPKMPGSPASNALIRPYKFDPHSQRYTADTPYNAADANMHSFYAGGGPVRHFALGGAGSAISQVSSHIDNTPGAGAPSTIPHYTYDPVTQHFSGGPSPAAAAAAAPAAMQGGQGAGLGSPEGQHYDLSDPNQMIAYVNTLGAGNQGSVSGDTGAGGSYAAGGGIGALAPGQGRFLKGPGDGVSDSIPATINGQHPARLANEEYVVPARVVSELGNGSSSAGAKRLDEMVARVGRARAKTVGSRSRLASDSGRLQGTPGMNIEIADVPPMEFVPEIAQLFPLHYEELCVDKEFPFEPDWDTYMFLADRHNLRVITVRADGELVGYMVFIIRPHMHYKSCLCAYEDLYYLRPDMRQGRLGIKMFKYAEEALKRIGVQKIVVHTKVHMDNSRLLEHLGYTLVDKVFAKKVEAL